MLLMLINKINQYFFAELIGVGKMSFGLLGNNAPDFYAFSIDYVVQLLSKNIPNWNKTAF